MIREPARRLPCRCCNGLAAGPTTYYHQRGIGQGLYGQAEKQRTKPDQARSVQLLLLRLFLLLLQQLQRG